MGPIYILVAKGKLAQFESSMDKFLCGTYFSSVEEAETYKETFKAKCIDENHMFSLKDDENLRITVIKLEMFK